MEEELIETLQGTLRPDAAIIQAAQTHLQQNVHPQPAAGLALISIVNAGDRLPLAIRQAAAVNLSLWIKERWSPFFNEFVGFPAGDGKRIALAVEAKGPVRQALLDSCTLAEVKLRGPMIKALINIASCDWPDEFPDLIPRVRSLLEVQAGTRESTVAIEGALSFLDDWFYNSMDETGLMSITKDILPNLEHIISQPELYPAPVRCRCVSIFNQMLETLWMVKEQYPEASKAVSAEIIPRWLTKLEAMVGADPARLIRGNSLDAAAAGELALQVQAWSTISTATHFPAQFKSRLPALLSTSLSSLSALQTAFESLHISSSTLPDGATDSAFFSTPADLAGKIIDFTGVAFQSSHSKSTTSASTLSTLLPLLRSYSRITVQEQEEWLENVSSFVAAGDEDELGALNSSMRARCADILAELVLVKEAETMNALKHAVDEAHEQADSRRQAGYGEWWKEEEAALALVGGIAEHIIEKLDEARGGHAPPPFDVERIFAVSVLPNMAAGSPSFLLGRCFVFASQFASVLPSDLASNFLEAAVGAIEGDGSADAEGDTIVQISAVRCIKNFHRHLPPAQLAPFAARILSRLGPLLASASDDTLVLIVETLQAVAMQEETASAEQTIPPAVYGNIVFESVRAWAKEASDRILQSAVTDMLEAFAAHKSPAIATAVIQRGMPVFADLLREGQGAGQDRYRSGVIIEGALEFAGAIATGASAELLLQSGAVLPFLGPLFHTLGQSDDREVFKNGATLLTSIVSKMPDEVLAWHDQAGVPALQHILALVSNMISPQDTSESGGLAVGDVLTTLLRKRPQSLSTVLPQLCISLVTRLSSTSSTSLAQSLIIPLAFLLKDHLNTVIALLSSHWIEGTGAKERVPALHVLMTKWCEFAGTFQGFWNTRVSTLGLCAFLQQARQSGLESIVVDGDLIPDDSNMIKTRSRAKAMPHRYTQIPLPAKVLKIVVGEYSQAVDGPPSQSTGRHESPGLDGEDDDDDDADEWDDDIDYAKKQRQDAFLSDMLGEDLDGGLEALIAQHDEEQFKDDAIYNMPFRSYLTTFFRELAQDSELATRLGVHLTPQERTVLQSAIA